MPRKNSVHESTDADSCPCGCCRWHSSRAIRAVLGLMFILIIVGFAASLIFSSSSYYYSQGILSFIGVILLIVFIGWIFGFFCSCRGVHWSRHGFGRFDEARMIIRRKYAEGKISKKEYDRLMRDIN